MRASLRAEDTNPVTVFLGALFQLAAPTGLAYRCLFAREQ